MKTSSLIGIALILCCAGSVAAQEGGYTGVGSDITNATSPSEGVVFGGQPTEAQLGDLAAADFKTVIDLRSDEEDRGFDEDAATQAAGLAYLKVPMSRGSMGRKETWDAFVEAFAAAEKPVLVHCASGGRVGAAYYAYLVAEEGMSREDARAKAASFGLRSDRLAVPVDHYLDGKGN